MDDSQDDSVFVTKLLSEVQGFPCIFAIGRSDYRDVGKKEAAWKTIASRLQSNPQDVQKRYKSLRDVYVRKRKVMTLMSASAAAGLAASKWRYFHQMAFLNAHLRESRTHDDVVPSANDPGSSTSRPLTDELASASPHTSPSACAPPSAKKRRPQKDSSIDEELIMKVVRQSAEALRSEDTTSLLWARSIALRLDNLKPRQRGRVRVRIETILQQAEFPAQKSSQFNFDY